MAVYPLRPRLDVAINYLVNGRLCTNVANYSAPVVAPTAAQMQTAADGLSARFSAPYKARLPDNCRFEGVEVRYLSTTHGRYAVSTVGNGPGVIGVVNAPPEASTLPTGDAIIVQKFGDGPPKRANGTVYLAGLDDFDVEGDRLSTNALERAQSVANAFAVANVFIGVEGDPCVLSRTALILFSIVGVNVKLVVGHLSRRRPVR